MTLISQVILGKRGQCQTVGSSVIKMNHFEVICLIWCRGEILSKQPSRNQLTTYSDGAIEI